MASTVLAAMCRESTGANLNMATALLQFISERFSADDYAEATSLLHSAFDEGHARRHHEERANR